MTKRLKTKARHGSGSLRLRGAIYYARWRSIQRLPNGKTRYILNSESTRTSDKPVAQRFLNRKLHEVGGHRRINVDPRRVSYNDMRQNWLARQRATGKRSLMQDAQGELGHPKLPRLDKFFSDYLAKDITVQEMWRFRAEGIERDGGL